MIKIHHINLGAMRPVADDPNPKSICHCLLLEEDGHYALIDTGLGVDEMARPEEMFGKAFLEGWQFEVNPASTAVAHLQKWGISPDAVSDIVLTHTDVDHAGGLPDFPAATVHVSAEELENLNAHNPRYLFNQFAHNPRWKTYAENDGEWFGLPSRRLALPFAADIRLIPLFGHTKGHCGVAIALAEGKWLLHAGDTYYRLREVTETPNPIEATVSHTCDDNDQRLVSLAALQRLRQENADAVSFFSTHDLLEYPKAAGKRVLFVTTSQDHFDGPNPHPTGVWLEELVLPYLALYENGAAITVASPLGGATPVDPRSAPTPEQAQAWAVAIEAARHAVPLATVQAENFDGIFIPGGHGPIFDLPENPHLAALVRAFDVQGKHIGSVCHGPAGLLGATQANGTPFVAGKTLTAYTWEEEILSKLDKEVPFILEQRLREQGANFVAGPARSDHVERDGNLITGQNPWSSRSVGLAFADALATQNTASTR